MSLLSGHQLKPDLHPTASYQLFPLISASETTALQLLSVSANTAQEPVNETNWVESNPVLPKSHASLQTKAQSSTLSDDNNRKCRIPSLVYRFGDCCAVAKLIRLDNESTSTKIPVRLVSLADESHEENYHKNVFFELPQQTSDADMLFFFLSAIKRRIGLDGKKPSTQLSNEFFSRKRAAEKGDGFNGEQTSDQICLKTGEKWWHPHLSPGRISRWELGCHKTRRTV